MISTKQLIDEYFKSIKYAKAKYLKAAIDVPALYDYEKEIGKQLIEMNTDEIVELIKRLLPKVDIIGIHYIGQFEQIIGRIRGIFEFYSDNYELIRNPCQSDKVRGANLIEMLSGGSAKLTKEYLFSVIDRIYNRFELNRAKYYELVILMFYCGFSHGTEILSFKKDNINFKNKQVFLKNHYIQLTDRCFDLLNEIHAMQYLIGYRDRTFDFRSYNGSYFKIPTYLGQFDFDNQDISYLGNTLHRVITASVNPECDCKLTFLEIYNLGLYDHLVAKFGKEELDRMLRARRDREAIDKVMGAAQDYGFTDNVTTLKRRIGVFMGAD